MSENSFENSTYSENNSYDEASSNPPESLSSPINRAAAIDDDFGAGVYGSRLTADMLTSLPVLSSNVTTTSIPYRTPFIKDAELSELLVRKQPKFMPQAPKCSKCSKNVYKAEEIRAANKTFHKLCFKCTACNKLLEPNILTEHAGDLFCKNCYAKNFGPKGYGVGLAIPTSPDTSFLSTSSSLASPTSAPSNSSVAASSSSASSSTSSLSNGSAGGVGSASSSALKWTFSSIPSSNGSMVHTKTTSSSHINSACNHEKRLSVSSVSGPVVITTGEANKCARCTKPVYAAEKVNAAGKTYHKLCFNCASCKKMLSSMNCCDNSEGDVFCKSCYGRQYGPKGVGPVGYGVGAGALQANS